MIDKSKIPNDNLLRIIEELTGEREPRKWLKSHAKSYGGYRNKTRMQTGAKDFRSLYAFALNAGANLDGLMIDDRWLKEKIREKKPKKKES